MVDEHNNNIAYRTPKSIPKKKERIRVFVHRKRLLPGILHKSIPSQSNSLNQLTSIIEKRLNQNKKNSRNNKNIVLINYKPVFIRSRQQKLAEPKSSSSRNNRQYNMTTTLNPNNSSSHSKINQQQVSFDTPDVEDPFVFIEMMYQRLFNEDGQLRSGTEPEVLANCVKQIVTHSRRNSMAQSTYPRTSSTTSFHHSISSRFIHDAFNEEEEPTKLSQKRRTTNTSRRSSKQSGVDSADHQQQQLHQFLNSYYHPQSRTSTCQTTITANNFLSVDDTDNEDFDTFSDLNSYRKIIRTPPLASTDEDTIHTDSKFLVSSGYQSVRSYQPIISKRHSENDHQYCSNCLYPPQIPVTSLLKIFQPIREIFTKYLNFIFMSKNILIIPLFIFLLRQRPTPIGN